MLFAIFISPRWLCISKDSTLFFDASFAYISFIMFFIGITMLFLSSALLLSNSSLIEISRTFKHGKMVSI